MLGDTTMRVGLTTTSEAKEKEILRSSQSQIATSLIDGGIREWTTRRYAEARVQISTSSASDDLETDVEWRGWSMVLDDGWPSSPPHGNAVTGNT